MLVRINTARRHPVDDPGCPRGRARSRGEFKYRRGTEVFGEGDGDRHTLTKLSREQCGLASCSQMVDA